MKKKIVAGINIGGAGNDKTAVAFLEMTSSAVRLINIEEGIGSNQRIHPDKQLSDIVSSVRNISLISINAPLSMPPSYLTGFNSYPKGQHPQEKYLARLSEENPKKALKGKRFLPYIHRPCDAYLRVFVDPALPHHEPMSASNAHLAARAQYLSKVAFKNIPIIEAYPKLSLLMLRRFFQLLKKQVTAYNSVYHGRFYRGHILGRFMDTLDVSISKPQLNQMLHNVEGFNAFILGYVAVLHLKDMTSQRPKGFPKSAHWIVYPKQDLKVFS